MEPLEIVTSALQTNAGLVDKALEGLSDDDLMQRPNDQCNPIGWTLWHQYRYEDRVISGIGDHEQVWITGGWHDRFGLPPDPAQLGMGDSLDQVMALRPTLENLRGYAAAVREKTMACLQTITPDNLDRDISAPGGGTRKAGDALGILLLDHFHHSGQVCYLRGYLTGKGWFAA